MSKPTAQGRASIAVCNLSLKFRTKDQMIGVINKILSDEIPWSFSYKEDVITETDGVSRTVFVLDVYEISWANNLTRFSGWVREFDYEDTP